MGIPSEPDAIEQARKVLHDATGTSVTIRPILEPKAGLRPDAILDAGNYSFAVEWKAESTAAAVSHAAEQVKRAASELKPGDAVPLVAVPYMGEVGRNICDQAKVSWLDLSGNASIHAPGLIVVREGKPNRFIKRGRPSSPFAPKSARIARWFLVHPRSEIRQADLARATGLGQGFVSRIVGRLIELDLLVPSNNQVLRVTNHDRLLDAWREDYNFHVHELIQGHVAAKSGEDLVKELRHAAKAGGVRLAFTGLAGAWIHDRHAGFNVVTAYLKQAFDEAWLAPLSFRAGERGANVWLLRPRDNGVFDGETSVDGIPVVHPVQVYLDLKGHSERSAEAAEEIRKRHLTWRTDE